MFWDLQGVDDLDALAFSLEEALADAEPRLVDAGITLDEIVGPRCLSDARLASSSAAMPRPRRFSCSATRLKR